MIVNKKQQNLSELVTRPENQQTATPLRPDKTATERQLLSNKSLMTATPPHPDSKPVEVTAACLLLLRLRRSLTATPHLQDKAQSRSGRNQIHFFSTIKQSVSRMVWAIFFLATFQSQPTRPLKPFANTKNRLVKLVLEDFWVF